MSENGRYDDSHLDFRHVDWAVHLSGCGPGGAFTYGLDAGALQRFGGERRRRGGLLVLRGTGKRRTRRGRRRLAKGQRPDRTPDEPGQGGRGGLAQASRARPFSAPPPLAKIEPAAQCRKIST